MGMQTAAPSRQHRGSRGTPVVAHRSGGRGSAGGGSGAGPRVRLVRAVATAVLGGLAALAVTLLFLRLAADSWSAATRPAVADPADLVLTGVCLIGAVLSGWLGVGTVAAALAALPGVLGRVGRVVAEQIAPAALRRGVAFLLGTSLVAAFAPGTAAAYTMPGSRATTATALLVPGVDRGDATPDPSFRPTTPAAPSTTGSSPGVAAPDPKFVPLGPLGPRPSQPAAPPAPAPAPAAPAPAPAPAPATATATAASSQTTGASWYLVRRGDTLWSIAARHLPPGAGPAQVAAAWPLWYAANRAVIGADPDRILPGQRLLVPTGVNR